MLVAQRIADTQARRTEAATRSQTVSGKRRMTMEEIQTLITTLGDIRDVLEKANRADEAEVY